MRKIDILEERLNAYLSINLDGFIRTYSEYYDQEEVAEIISKTDYADKLQLLFQAAKSHNYPLYLIIDEYDKFSNVVLTENGKNMQRHLMWKHSDKAPPSTKSSCNSRAGNWLGWKKYR